jgi:DNA-binding NtrC family response regulator
MENEGKLVFFIDDDKIILDLLEYTFQSRDGIEVKTFSSGEEGLENIKATRPDLVVLDYNFHKQGSQAMTGLETLKKINDFDGSIRVIMLTSETDHEIVDNFRKYGAYKYVCKDSYFIDTLLETLKKELVSDETLN